MKPTLIGFNAVAVAALAVPALLILSSAAPSLGRDPFWPTAYVVSLGLGCVCLFRAMLKLSTGEEAEMSGAVARGLLGVGLIAIPLTVVLGVALAR